MTEYKNNKRISRLVNKMTTNLIVTETYKRVTITPHFTTNVTNVFQVGQYYDIKVDRATPSANPHGLQHFKTLGTQPVFLYSAMANPREPSPDDINIIINAFDATDSDALQCCVLLKDGESLWLFLSVYLFIGEVKQETET